MHGITAASKKKIAFFGAGFLLLISAVIAIGVYSANRADANRLSNSVPTAEEADMHIDVKIGESVVELDSITNAIEPESALGAGQQAEVNNSSPNVEVRVNGMSVEVPENGSIHKEVTTENGTASIDVSSQSSSSSSSSRFKTSIRVDGDSSVRVRNLTK